MVDVLSSSMGHIHFSQMETMFFGWGQRLMMQDGLFACPFGSAKGVTDTSRGGQGKTCNQCLVMAGKEAG